MLGSNQLYEKVKKGPFRKRLINDFLILKSFSQCSVLILLTLSTAFNASYNFSLPETPSYFL